MGQVLPFMKPGRGVLRVDGKEARPTGVRRVLTRFRHTSDPVGQGHVMPGPRGPKGYARAAPTTALKRSIPPSPAARTKASAPASTATLPAPPRAIGSTAPDPPGGFAGRVCRAWAGVPALAARREKHHLEVLVMVSVCRRRSSDGTRGPKTAILFIFPDRPDDGAVAKRESKRSMRPPCGRGGGSRP